MTNEEIARLIEGVSEREDGKVVVSQENAMLVALEIRNNMHQEEDELRRERVILLEACKIVYPLLEAMNQYADGVRFSRFDLGTGVQQVEIALEDYVEVLRNAIEAMKEESR